MAEEFYPDLERSVLGSCLVRSNQGDSWVAQLVSVAENKKGESIFSDPDCRMVYKAIIHVTGNNLGAISLPRAAVVDRLNTLLSGNEDDKKGRGTGLFSMGAESYVNYLMTSPPITSNEQYEQSLKLLVQARSIRSQLREIRKLQEDVSDENVHVTPEDLSSRLRGIAEDTETTKTIKKASDVLSDIESGESATMWSVPIGIESIDKALGGKGLESGNVTVIAARAKIGKTTFMMQMVKSVIESGNAVMVLSYETKEIEFMAKLLASFSQVDWDKIKNHLAMISQKKEYLGFTEEESRDVERAKDIIRDVPLYTSFDKTSTQDDISSFVMTAKSDINGLKNNNGEDMNLVLFVDYIQIQVSDISKMVEGITELSRYYKILAGTANISVVYLAQINREGSEGPPRINNVKGSGSIEADADTVFLLDRPYQRDPESDSEPWRLIVDAVTTRVAEGGINHLYIDHATQTVHELRSMDNVDTYIDEMEDLLQ